MSAYLTSAITCGLNSLYHRRQRELATVDEPVDERRQIRMVFRTLTSFSNNPAGIRANAEQVIESATLAMWSRSVLKREDCIKLCGVIIAKRPPMFSSERARSRQGA